MEQFTSYPLELKYFCVFKNRILIRPFLCNVFNCDNHKVIKLINQLRVGLSYLREHKFKHKFQDCLRPICRCSLDIEQTAQFFLHCPYERYTLLSTFNKIEEKS